MSGAVDQSENPDRFDSGNLNNLTGQLQGFINRGEIAGLVALVNSGNQTHVDVLGVQDLETSTPMRRESIFRIASMTKPVVAVAAMTLVEENKITLDSQVQKWLPELQNLRVLKSIDSEIDDTVPLARAITLRDLLTFTLGQGMIMAKPGTYPLQKCMADAGLITGGFTPTLAPDQWIKAFAAIPLASQPGERWLYHTGADVLAVLIGRISGEPLDNFLQQRIFEPLSMNDTAYSASTDKVNRLTTAYQLVGGKLGVIDKAEGGKSTKPPVFACGGTGLLSTADDYLRFAHMMLAKGCYSKNGHAESRILKEETINEMLRDQITAEQKINSPFSPGFWDNNGWGLGVSVVTKADKYSDTTGRFGWNGGLGTMWFSDPVKNLTGILLTQTAFSSPTAPEVCLQFLSGAYRLVNAR